MSFFAIKASYSRELLSSFKNYTHLCHDIFISTLVYRTLAGLNISNISNFSFYSNKYYNNVTVTVHRYASTYSLLATLFISNRDCFKHTNTVVVCTVAWRNWWLLQRILPGIDVFQTKLSSKKILHPSHYTIEVKK